MAAPIAPEAVTQPTAPAAPPSAPGIADTIAAAREKIAAGQPIMPQPEPLPVAAAPAPPAGDPPVAPLDLPPTGEDETVPEPDAPPVEVPPVEGAASVIDLPARRPGEAPLSVEVSDPVIAERLRQAVNGYERKQDTEARLEEANGMIREYEQVVEYATTDPVGFTLSNIPTDLHEHLVLRLLSQPDMWAKMQERVFDMADDTTREMMRLRLQNDENANREAMAARAQARVAAERSARAVGKAVSKIVNTLPAEARASAEVAIMNSIKDHAQRTRIAAMSVDDIPVVTAGTLRKLGLNPLSVADVLAGKVPAPPSKAVAAPPARTAPTGQTFVQKAQARASVAMTTPAGAGAASTQIPQPPKGLGIKETIQWARTNGVLTR